jgi:peptidoglycan/LPS O-acetylase OafA/YrhL
MTDGQILKLFGLFYFLVGLGLFLNPKYYQKMLHDFVRHKIIIYVMSMLTVVVGFLLVSFHNVWVWGWTLLITVIGWLALIKGILALVFPEIFIKISKVWVKKNLNAWAVVIIILGVFLFMVGCNL